MRLRSGAGLVVILSMLGACGSPPQVPLTTVRVGVLPILDSLPFRVMVDQGFAAEEGLKLEVKTFEGGGPALAGMYAGEIDATYAGLLPILTAVGNGDIPARATVASANALADASHPAGGVFVADSIRSWKDLNGKRVAINVEGSVPHVAIAIRLLEEGVKDVTFVEIPFPNMGLAVAGGDVVAATMWEPFVAQSLLRGDGHLLDWVVGGKPFESFPISALVVSTRLVERKDVAPALVRAHLKTLRWITTHPVAARGILRTWLGLTPQVASRTRLNAWSKDGTMDEVLLEQIQQTLRRYGFAKKIFSIEQILDDTVLKEASRSKS